MKPLLGGTLSIYYINSVIPCLVLFSSHFSADTTQCKSLMKICVFPFVVVRGHYAFPSGNKHEHHTHTHMYEHSLIHTLSTNFLSSFIHANYHFWQLSPLLYVNTYIPVCTDIYILVSVVFFPFPFTISWACKYNKVVEFLFSKQV